MDSSDLDGSRGLDDSEEPSTPDERMFEIDSPFLDREKDEEPIKTIRYNLFSLNLEKTRRDGVLTRILDPHLLHLVFLGCPSVYSFPDMCVFSGYPLLPLLSVTLYKTLLLSDLSSGHFLYYFFN